MSGLHSAILGDVRQALRRVATPRLGEYHPRLQLCGLFRQRTQGLRHLVGPAKPQGPLTVQLRMFLPLFLLIIQLCRIGRAQLVFHFRQIVHTAHAPVRAAFLEEFRFHLTSFLVSCPSRSYGFLRMNPDDNSSPFAVRQRVCRHENIKVTQAIKAI